MDTGIAVPSIDTISCFFNYFSFTLPSLICLASKAENSSTLSPRDQNLSLLLVTSNASTSTECMDTLPVKSSTPTQLNSSSYLDTESIVAEIASENIFSNLSSTEGSTASGPMVPVSNATQLNRKWTNRTPSPKVLKADSLGRKSPSVINVNTTMKQRGSPRTVSAGRNQQRRSPCLIQNLMTKKPSGKLSASSDDVFLFQSVNFDNSISIRDDSVDSNSVIKLSSENQKEIQKEILLQKEEYRISRAAEIYEESSTISSPSESTERENYMSANSDIAEERVKAKLISKLMSLGSIQDMIKTLQDIERVGLNQKLNEVSMRAEIPKARRCKSGSESMLKSRMVDDCDIEHDLHLHVEDPEITKYTGADFVAEKYCDWSFRPNVSKMLDSSCSDPRVSSPSISPCALNGVKYAWNTSTSTKVPKLKLDGILRPTSTKNEGISSVDSSVIMGDAPANAPDTVQKVPRDKNFGIHSSGSLILSPRTAFDDLSVNSEDSSIRSSEKM